MVITSWLAALTSKLFGIKKKSKTRKQQSKLAIQATQSSEVLETRTLMTVNAVNDTYPTGINEDAPFFNSPDSVMDNDDFGAVNGTTNAFLDTNTSSGTVGFNSDGTFAYFPNGDFESLNNGETADVTFTYHVEDDDFPLVGTGATVTLTIHGSNDQTNATNTTQSAGYTEDGGAQAVGSAIVVSDVDTNDVITATLTMSNAAAGTLAAPGGNFNAGVLTITGTASDVTTALASLTFSPAADFNSTFTIGVNIADGLEDGTTAATGTITMNGTAVNDAPVANNSSETVAEDGTLNSSVTASDVDLDALDYLLVSDVTNGTLTLNLDGTFTYEPDPDFNGSDSFTFKANDGTVDSNTATVTITVTAVNDAPVANNSSETVAEDGTLNSSVTASDVDLDALDYLLVSDVTHGTLTLNLDGTFSYEPDADYNGPDSFTFKANDGTIDSNTATVTITVTAVNDAPVANNSSETVAEDGTLNSSVTASDVDLDALDYLLVSDVTHGTLTLNLDGTFSYEPDADYNGPDSFTFKANDGTADSNTATVTITVTAVQDAPVASNSSETVDEDGSFASLAVANDADLDPLDYILVSDVANGTLVFNPDGSYTYAPDADFNGTDSFTFKVNDGTVDSNTATVSITVTSVNDAPVASDDTYTVDEDTDLIVAVGAGVLFNDSDLHGGAPSENNTPLTADVVADPTHGTLTLNADGSFTYTPDANYFGADSFTYTATDSLTGVSNVAVVNITVTNINDDPLVVDSGASVNEDTTLNSSVTGLDADNDPLTYLLESDVANGTLTLNTDGTFSYTPDPDFNGTDSFSYKVNDGTVDSNTATVTITINAVNDAPTFTVGANQSSAEDAGAQTVNNFISVFSPGPADEVGQTIDFIVSNDSNSLFSVQPSIDANGNLTYTAALNQNGTATVTVQIHDDGGTALGGVDTSASHTFTITITSVNDAPVATDDSYGVDEDDVLVIDALTGVLANDSDLHGGAPGENNTPLTVALVDDPLNGSVTLNADGSFTYTPDADFNGTDTFTYEVTDDEGGISNVATVTITVGSINDDPIATDDSYTTDEDTPLIVGTLTGVLSNDSDLHGGAPDEDNTPLIASVVDEPLHGDLILEDDGSFTYTPDADFFGTDTFTYEVTDDVGGISNLATVTITVVAVNDAPVANNDSETIDEDTVLSSSVSATDVENDPLTYSLVDDVLHGTLVFNSDGTYTYTPDANYNGTDSFTFQVNDGTADSNIATVSITIDAVNDAPVAQDDAVTVNEDDVLNDSVAATDVENDPLTYALVADVTNGVLVFNTDGTYTYTPNADFNGTDTFTFRANDGDLDSNVATVTITVVSVNDDPAATDDTYATAEDTPLIIDALTGVLANDSDLNGGAPGEDNTPLTASIVTQPSHGTVTLNSDGSFTYTPDANYNGADSFTYQAVDSLGGISNMATVNLTVTSANDGPVAGDDAYATDEDTPLSVVAGLGVLLNDSDLHGGAPGEDNTPLTVAVVANPTHGLLILNADGSFSYTPDADYNGSDSFTYQATDSMTGVSNTATVTITVNSVNDDPVANDDSYATTEDVPLVIDALTGVVANDSDLLGGAPSENNTPLSASIVANPTHGAVTLNADGSFTYTPDADYNGTDSFTYHVIDSLGGISNTATVQLTIFSANDAAVAVDDLYSTTEDTPLTVDALTGVLANDSDLHNGAPGEDNQPLLATVVANPTHGTVTLNVDGSFTYTPDADFNGTDSFTYRVEDNQSAFSNTATVVITVGSVNDAPLVADDSYVTDEDTPLIVDDLTGVLANDSDSHGGAPDENNLPMTVSVVAAPTHGTLTLNSDGSFTYTPDADYNGTDTFTYEVTDSLGATSGQATVTIAVNSVNDAPVATDDSYSTNEDAPLTIDALTGVLVNDSDLHGGAIGEDNTPLTANVVANPAHGTVTLNADGSFTYTPEADFNGTDSFTYTATDSLSGVSNTATVTITVNAVNDAPSFTAGANQTVDEDAAAQTVTGWATNIAAGPADEAGQTLTFTVTNNTNAALFSVTPAIAADGTLTYTLAANANGSADITIILTDDGGGTDTSAPQTFTITATAVNDAPTFTLGADQTILEDAAPQTVAGFATAISAGPANEAGQTLAFNITTNNDAAFAALPAIDAVTGNLTYAVNNNFSGDIVVTVTLSDNGGIANGGVDTSAPQTFTIHVTSTNDVPVAANDTATTAEDTGVDIDILANDTDGENDPLQIFVSAPQHGTVFIDDNGTPGDFTDDFVHYTPAANYNGTDSFTYLVFDGQGGTDSATVNITITPVNDAPTASNGTVTTAEDTPVTTTLPANDIDSGSLTYSIVSQPTHGTISDFNAATGSYTYTPNANYFGPDSFTFKVNDGEFDSNEGTISLTVTPVNDPITALDSTLTTAEDTAVNGTLTFDDIDDEALVFSIETQPAHGTITNFNAATGTYTYTPDSNYNGPDSFTFKVNDGADSNTATISITVTPANDAPVANDATFTVAEGAANASVVGTVTATDIDTGDTRTFSITGGNTGNVFAINATTGVITVANGAGLDFETTPTYNLVITVTDAGGLTDTANVTVNLTNVAEDLVLSLPSAPATYVVARGPVFIDSAASAADADSPNINYAGGSLRVQITTNFDAKDRLEVQSGGNIVVKGKKILFNGTQIATITNQGKGANALEISFLSGATETAVNALLKLITFRNTNKKDPRLTDRTVTYTLRNADNSENDTATQTVHLSQNSPARSVQVGSSVVDYSNGAAPVEIDPTATLTGPASLTLNGGKLTVEITSGISTSNRLLVKNVGGITVSGNDILFNGNKIATGTTTGNILTIKFVGTNATPAAGQALLRAITFSTTSSNTLLTNRVISYKLTEVTGISGAPVTKQIHFV